MLKKFIRCNLIFRCIYYLWKINVNLFYQITGQTYPTLDVHQSAQEKLRQRRYIKHMCIVSSFLFIVWIYFAINFVVSSHLTEKLVLTTSSDSDVHRSKSTIIIQSIRNIYIDIGCFNGETIEYFLHFTSDSAMYDIYTFEPDPDNYRLCKKRLSEERFAHLNITILQNVVWIRDEKVFYRAERGRQSRISPDADDGESIQVDAIDFSSWLTRLHKPNGSKIHIKMSMPGAEVPVLEKMIVDDTLGLVSKYEIEWTDRLNPRIRAIRIYVQLMFDTYGFDCLYYTRLQDTRRVYQANGSFGNVTKHYDWQKISESDALAHYVARIDIQQQRDDESVNIDQIRE